MENIAKIDYDNLNNPVRIQFTNGNVTKYVYSATGEKLRVTYQTAVPNITVAIGSTREFTRSEILYTDSIDYLLGGALTLKNGRIDKLPDVVIMPCPNLSEQIPAMDNNTNQ